MRLAGRVLNPAPARSGGPVDAAVLARDLLAAARALRSDGGSTIDGLAARLHAVDPFAPAEDAERVAFWLNLYNALFLHATHLRPLRLHLALNRGLFRAAAYRVGSRRYSLDVIEHGVLRRGARAPGARRPPLERGDPRRAAAPAALDPRIHFALHCGARSCPPIHAYDAAALDRQLDDATRAYMAAECDLDQERARLVLPGLMRLYRADFGTREDAAAFAARMLPPEERGYVERNRERIRVSYHRFDARIAVTAA